MKYTKNKGGARGKRDITAKRAGLTLGVIFALSVLLRYLFSVLSVNMPTVYIDEGLYINIARSLFYDGEVMYRAQPVSYVYLVYPIFLMPLFLLPSSISLYRAAQLYNALLMSSSVIPAYLLGRKMDCSRKKALLLALFTALIPEAALSSFLTAESLYYPAMLWVFLIAAKAALAGSKRERNACLFALGAVNGILYFIKPICVIFGCCFCAAVIVKELRSAEKKNAAYPLGALAVTGAVIALGYTLYRLLFDKASVLNLYEKQISQTSAASIPVMLQSVLYHIAGLALSMGGAFIFLPGFFRKSLDENKGLMLNASVLGIFASIVGIAVMVVPYNYTGSGLVSPIHLRYLMFYAPLILVFSLSAEYAEKIKNTKAICACFIVFAVLTVFPGGFSFFNYQAGTFDSPALIAYYERSPYWTGVLLTVVTAVIYIWAAFYVSRRRSAEKIRRAGILLMALFFAVNGVCAYTCRRTDDKSFEQYATQTAEYTADAENAVVISNNRYDDSRGYLLDSHLRRPMQTVVMNDLLIGGGLDENGVFQSWTPMVQSPNTANLPVINADTLIFDITTADYVEFADGVDVTHIGPYTVARFDPDKPVLRTAICGMNGYIMNEGDMCYLMVYDRSLTSTGSLTMKIRMRSVSTETCKVTFTCQNTSKTVTLTREFADYTVTLPVSTESNYTIVIKSDEAVSVYEYHVADLE